MCTVSQVQNLQARTISAQLAWLVVVYLFARSLNHLVETVDCTVCAALGSNQFALLCVAAPCADACSFTSFLAAAVHAG